MSSTKVSKESQPSEVSRRNFMASAGAALALPVFVSEGLVIPQKKKLKLIAQVEASCSGFNEAAALANTTQLESLVADEAIFIDFDGKVRNREQIIAYSSEMGNKGLLNNVVMGEASVHIVSLDTAIMPVKMTATGLDVEGRSITGTYNLVHFFVKRNTIWQVVAIHMIKLSDRVA